MIFAGLSICAVIMGFLLIFINFFKYDKDFRCDWKRYGKILNLTFPAIISLILATIMLIGIILFISLSFLSAPDVASKGIIIFSMADLFTIGIIKISFLIIDKIRYDILLTRYIKRTFNVEENSWQPEDPIRAEDTIFEYKHIKKRIAKMTQARQRYDKNKLK